MGRVRIKVSEVFRQIFSLPEVADSCLLFVVFVRVSLPAILLRIHATARKRVRRAFAPSLSLCLFLRLAIDFLFFLSLLLPHKSHFLLGLKILNNLSVVVRIVTIPSVSFCLVSELCLNDCLVLSYVFTSVFGPNFSWSFNTGLRSVSHRAAVGARTFTKFGYLLSLWSYDSSLMVRVNGLFLVRLLLPLMMQGF